MYFMQCQRCGKELGNDTRCTFCGYEIESGNVREMTNTEKNFYDGVTIDTGDTEDKNSAGSNADANTNTNYNSYSRRTNYNPNYNFSRRKIYTSNSGIFSRLVDKFLVSLLNNNRLAKIAATLIVVALAALMFFVALPILFLLLAVGIALFAFSKLTK